MSKICNKKKGLFFALFATILNLYTPFLTPQTVQAASNPTSRVGWVADEIATDAPNNRRMIRTSDGTLHFFASNLGANNICNGASVSGLSWFVSTDNGSTWVCEQLVTSNNRSKYAAAVTDDSDNIYLIYSGESIIYRKLTKGSGSTWTMENEQVIVAGNGSDTNSYAVIEIEGNTRLWVAYRHSEANKSVRVYYSDNLSASPTWTLSAELDTPDASITTHRPVIVRYGSNTGVIYTSFNSENNIQWRHRADSDELNSWSTAETITTTTSSSSSFAATVDNSNQIHLVYGATGTSNNTVVTYRKFNGSSWSSPVTISGTGNAGGHSPSITTDGTNIWIFYQGRHKAGVGGGTTIGRVVYKKGVPPFESANFDGEVVLNTSDRAYDKVFTQVSGTYTDISSQANGIGSATLVGATDDAVYFGLTEKYRSVTGKLSTAGSGGVVTYEYWDGSTWTTLTTFSTYFPNFTSSITARYEVNFSPPEDWTQTELDSTNAPGSYYYVRARVTTPYTTTPAADDLWAYPQTGTIQLLTKSTGEILPIIWYETSPFTTGNALIQFNSLSINNAPSTPSSLGGHVNGNYTNDSSPTLTFTLSDQNDSDSIRYRIQIDDSSDFSSPDVDYTSTLGSQGTTSFTVGQAAGSGSYSVGSQNQTLTDGSYYWRVKAIDNSSAESSYSIANSGNIAFIIDATTPSTPGTPTTTSPTSDTTPTWTWTASTDSGSGLASDPYLLQWSQDSTFVTSVNSSTASINSFTHSTPLSAGTWYFRIKATDEVNNESSYSPNGTVEISTTAPSGSIQIDFGNPYTNGSSATLLISASDEFDDTTDLSMILSENSDFSDANYEAYSTSKIWTFSNLIDGIKTIYVKFKNSLNNESETYSDSIMLDRTSPNVFSLESPHNNAYTNNERPTFRWKAATVGDDTSRLSKYKLEVDNGEDGGFIIDNIPVSRTTDLEKDSYIIRYENFDDSNDANNYISVLTKSSSDWKPTENDGSLIEGKRKWSVSAIDNAGNTRTETNTLYVDQQGPDIIITQIDYSVQSPPLRTSNSRPIIFGTITDSLVGDTKENFVVSGPSNIEVIIEGKNANGTYSPHSTQTLRINENYWKDTNKKAPETENTYAKWSSFSMDFAEPLQIGTYRLRLTGKDHAGNSGPKTIATLIITNNPTKSTSEHQIDDETGLVAPSISPTPTPTDSSTFPDLQKEEKETESFSIMTRILNMLRTIWENIKSLFFK